MQHTTKRRIKYNTVGDEVLDEVVDEVTFSAGDKVVSVAGIEAGIEAVGNKIVALGLTRFGYSMSEGSSGPKHFSSLLSGKFSQVNISGHWY